MKSHGTPGSEDETHPVGKKKPNTWGIYDTQGNVREWVQDFYSASYYSVSPAEDPTGPAAGVQGGRGGGPRGRGEPPPTPPSDSQQGTAQFGQRRGPLPRGGANGRGRGGGPRQLPVMRGGGWDNLESFIRVSARYHYYGDTLRVSDVGFRAARERIVQ